MDGKILEEFYGMHVLSMEKAEIGAGSDTYFVECDNGKYVVKFPCESEMNNPDLEPLLCEFLLSKGISVCEFIKNKEGGYISLFNRKKFHVQKFLEGKVYDLNTAPDWLLRESAKTLGLIHNALKGYSGLTEGIGRGFFEYMTPQRALQSYMNTMETAKRNGDEAVQEDLAYRIDLMKRFPDYRIDVDKLTCQSTHGDYFISQLICGESGALPLQPCEKCDDLRERPKNEDLTPILGCEENVRRKEDKAAKEEGRINAVIDWTTACVHPVVWEIIRSYVYASPRCINGEIDILELANYVNTYQKYAKLNEYDLATMAKLFYYQIAVCDYYNQYYQSTADNRDIYLHQAVFSTKLMHWFEENMEELTEELMKCGAED